MWYLRLIKCSTAQHHCLKINPQTRINCTDGAQQPVHRLMSTYTALPCLPENMCLDLKCINI